MPAKSRLVLESSLFLFQGLPLARLLGQRVTTGLNLHYSSQEDGARQLMALYPHGQFNRVQSRPR